MQRRRIGAPIASLIWIRISVGPCLGVFDENIEVAIFIKNAGVEQLVLAPTDCDAYSSQQGHA